MSEPGVYVADQGDDGFWYVRHRRELDRPVEQRDWVLIASADPSDKGYVYAFLAAKGLSDHERLCAEQEKAA